ncbi:FAD dependent oxidoreductase [Trichoderma austrokoningii]
MAANGDVSVPRSESPTGSPRSASISLQAAASMNAGLQREPSRRSSNSSLPRGFSSPSSGRRRSTILMNLQLNDPSVPAPGEMFQQDPVRASPQPMSGAGLPPDPSRHHRAPSLGELHQELEAEQEGHVNRLLNMIRQQQLELQRLQASHPQAVAADEAAAGSERAPRSLPVPINTQSPTGNHIPSASSSSFSRSPIFPHQRNSMEMARADMQRRSRTPSRNASPRLRATSISAESGDWSLFRDESAFYQAETQMLTRENQMLRHRIRELEKQVNDLSTSSPVPNEPSVPSNLTRSSTSADEVIGGGVVGLAIARQLSLRTSSTVLIERHAAVGTETSSRNSEVIHAGIYYGKDSLKTRLCIRGRDLLYELCEARGVAHKRTGKWLVAQNAVQREALERIHALCRNEIGVPVRWVGQREIEQRGEGVRAEAGALESPTTGIVDSHGLMLCLQGLFEDAGGVVALGSPVKAIRAVSSASSSSKKPGSSGWEFDVADGPDGAVSTMTAETLINAAGLGAVAIHNMIVPPVQHKQLFYAKGNYFSYAASSGPRISRLIYPAPEPGAGGLGTHLTLDLAGRMRFGPDVEWVDDADDLTPNASRLDQAVAEIRNYLPGVDAGALVPDYAGIRPKLAPKGAALATDKDFNDFIVRKEDGYQGWVNLLGIESPGLTSSLAIAEMVDQLLYGSQTAEAVHA